MLSLRFLELHFAQRSGEVGAEMNRSYKPFPASVQCQHKERGKRYAASYDGEPFFQGPLNVFRFIWVRCFLTSDLLDSRKKGANTVNALVFRVLDDLKVPNAVDEPYA